MATLERIGVDEVGLEEFEFLGYEPRSAALELLTPVSPAAVADTVPCGPLQNTADLSAEGDAVFVGDGCASDLESAEERIGGLTGRVVVAWPTDLAACASALEARGVAALVNVVPTAGGLVGSHTARLYPPPERPPWSGQVVGYPGVSIGFAAARRLLAAMTSGTVRLRVTHSAAYGPCAAANVTATIRGAVRADELVLVGAHYDTQLDCGGAWDNATGVATLLEIARALVARRPDRTVRLIGFTAEETGLWGSTHHARLHRAELGSVVGMLNLDTIGSPFNDACVVVASPALRSLAWDVATEAGLSPADHELPAEQPWFDHTPFADAGVAVCSYLTRGVGHPYYHSAGDTLECVHLPRMVRVARAAAAMARELASI